VASDTYIPPIIGPAGLTVPSYNAIRDYLLGQFKSIYGQNVYLGNDSSDYQFISILALAMYDLLQVGVMDYNNRSPVSAIGAALDSLVKINGLMRKVASFSTCTVTLAGVSGTVVNGGVVIDVNGVKWNLPPTVTIGGAGTVDVTATAAVSGSVDAGIGQINKISTPTAGWTSVTNAAAASPGQPYETDSQLRTRQAISTELPSITMLTGTIAGIAAVAGVTRFNVVENPTGAVDALGNPPHSITAVVEGGAGLDVATAIYNNKGIGCFTNGGNSVSLTDSISGVISLISFDRPTYVPIYVTIPIHPLSAAFTSAVSDAVQAAVIAYLNSLQIGELATYSGIVSAAMAVNANLSTPIFTIRGMTLGTAPSPSGTSDVDINFDQVAQGIVGNITISSV
jgi:uncharacterized phage protein gp47/JayE